MSRGRPSGEKTRCGGLWTEARFRSFVKGNLRSATRKWQPIQQCKKNAHVGRGVYLCQGCNQEVAPTIYDETKRKRITNIFVDHIKPIVDPETGFTTWDEVIEGMFCEIDNLQLLCKACHDVKCEEEKAVANQRRKGITSEE